MAHARGRFGGMRIGSDGTVRILPIRAGRVAMLDGAHGELERRFR